MNSAPSYFERIVGVQSTKQSVCSRNKDLVIFFIRRCHCIYRTFSCHLITFQIFVVGGDFVNHGAVWQDFHDAVCGCLYDLVITGSEEDVHPGI